jgi:tetratricopeptide (TPR) repeat protein
MSSGSSEPIARARHLHRSGAVSEACEIYREVLAREPRNARAHHLLGLCLEELGQFEPAVSHYRAALNAQPGHARALGALLAMPGFRAEDALVLKAQRLLGQPTLEAGPRAKLHFGLGKHLERAGDFDAAFGHFVAGNAAQRPALPPFDPRALVASVDSLASRFDAGHFRAVAGAGHPSDRPVFVVGMPRSGTTLVEQILASHPAVFGAGELTLMMELSSEPFPRDVEAITPCAQRYLARLDVIAPAASRVVDKNPLNFAQLGMIATLFPRAKIIHCRRHPLDVALSCYAEPLKGLGFASDLADIGEFIVQKERLMEHWRRVLPSPMHELDYERFVVDQEAGTRALVAHCGLEWNDACLGFFRTERHVNTPSRWQVRQPIFASSVGRWHPYRRYLQPVVDALERAGLSQNL